MYTMFFLGEEKGEPKNFYFHFDPQECLGIMVDSLAVEIAAFFSQIIVTIVGLAMGS